MDNSHDVCDQYQTNDWKQKQSKLSIQAEENSIVSRGRHLTFLTGNTLIKLFWLYLMPIPTFTHLPCQKWIGQLEETVASV